MDIRMLLNATLAAFCQHPALKRLRPDGAIGTTVDVTGAAVDPRRPAGPPAGRRQSDALSDGPFSAPVPRKPRAASRGRGRGRQPRVAVGRGRREDEDSPRENSGVDEGGPSYRLGYVASDAAEETLDGGDTDALANDGDDGLTDAERRAKRMLSNRESARRSRARKHERLQSLQGRITQLTDENNERSYRLSALTELANRFEEENARLESLTATVRRTLSIVGAIAAQGRGGCTAGPEGSSADDIALDLGIPALRVEPPLQLPAAGSAEDVMPRYLPWGHGDVYR